MAASKTSVTVAGVATGVGLVVALVAVVVVPLVAYAWWSSDDDGFSPLGFLIDLLV